MRSGATIWRAALTAVLCVAFGGLERPAGAKAPEEPKQIVISFYGSEAAARDAMNAVKAASDRGEVQLEAHTLVVKDANGKVKFKDKRAKGSRAGQAVVAVGSAMGAHTGLGVGSNFSTSTAYLTSVIIGMPMEMVVSLSVALKPGEVALVSAVDARRAKAAATLQETGSERIVTYDLPKTVGVPDDVREPSTPIEKAVVAPASQ